jgi:hypothetical protein
MSVRHCGPMEMHDLLIRAPLCNNERDATIGTEWLSVSHAGHCVQTGDDDGRIGQNHRRMVIEGRAAGPVGEQCILEVTANALWLDHHCLAGRADEQRIRCVKLHDPVDIRSWECLGPFFQNRKHSSSC